MRPTLFRPRLWLDKVGSGSPRPSEDMDPSPETMATCRKTFEMKQRKNREVVFIVAIVLTESDSFTLSLRNTPEK